VAGPAASGLRLPPSTLFRHAALRQTPSTPRHRPWSWPSSRAKGHPRKKTIDYLTEMRPNSAPLLGQPRTSPPGPAPRDHLLMLLMNHHRPPGSSEITGNSTLSGIALEDPARRVLLGPHGKGRGANLPGSMRPPRRAAALVKRRKPRLPPERFSCPARPPPPGKLAPTSRRGTDKVHAADGLCLGRLPRPIARQERPPAPAMFPAPYLRDAPEKGAVDFASAASLPPVKREDGVP